MTWLDSLVRALREEFKEESQLNQPVRMPVISAPCEQPSARAYDVREIEALAALALPELDIVGLQSSAEASARIRGFAHLSIAADCLNVSGEASEGEREKERMRLRKKRLAQALAAILGKDKGRYPFFAKLAAYLEETDRQELHAYLRAELAK